MYLIHLKYVGKIAKDIFTICINLLLWCTMFADTQHDLKEKVKTVNSRVIVKHSSYKPSFDSR